MANNEARIRGNKLINLEIKTEPMATAAQDNKAAPKPIGAQTNNEISNAKIKMIQNVKEAHAQKPVAPKTTNDLIVTCVNAPGIKIAKIADGMEPKTARALLQKSRIMKNACSWS